MMGELIIQSFLIQNDGEWKNIRTVLSEVYLIIKSVYSILSIEMYINFLFIKSILPIMYMDDL